MRRFVLLTALIASITILPSYTNINYLIDDEYVMRIPGKGSELFIDRKAEYHNAQEAWKYGFNAAKIYYFNPETGFQLTSYVHSDVEWDDFYKKDEMGALARLLKRIHSSAMDFKNEVDVFERFNLFLGGMPASERELKNAIDALRPILYHSAFQKVPCHNDSIPSNVLRKAGELYFIDWECSGKNHPAWDFAHLSCLMQYTEEQDRFLIDNYGCEDPELMYHCMVLFKPVSEFWIGSWAYSQDEKLLTYAKEHLQRCRNHLQSERFKQALEYVDQNLRNKTR